LSISYKNKIRLIEDDYFNHNLKEDLVIQNFFKGGVWLTIATFGILFISKI